jgi:photosystem II stability/assembly factor-like uncharacterized protein
MLLLALIMASLSACKSAEAPDESVAERDADSRQGSEETEDPAADERDAASNARDAGRRQQPEEAGTSDAESSRTSDGCKLNPSSAPTSKWINATGNLAGLASECGNLTLVAADPCSDRVIAGVAKGGLWLTTNRGAAWTKLGSGAGSQNIAHRPASIVFDPDHPHVFYESGIYGALNDGVYKTEDDGATFKKLGEIGHIDLISVDFSDPKRQTLLAGVHETKRKLFRSRDGGASWLDIGQKLPADSHFSSAPLVLDARRFLLGACGWGDGACGVYASADGGDTWKKTSSESPAGQPLWLRQGAIVWSTIWASGAIVSKDSGQTFSKVSGPRSAAVELPDGRIVAVGSDHLIISSDQGATWKNIGEPLPYQPAGVSYSPGARTFFIWHNDCKEVVLADAVMSAGFDG